MQMQNVLNEWYNNVDDEFHLKINRIDIYFWIIYYYFSFYFPEACEFDLCRYEIFAVCTVCMVVDVQIVSNVYVMRCSDQFANYDAMT